MIADLRSLPIYAKILMVLSIPVGYVLLSTIWAIILVALGI